MKSSMLIDNGDPGRVKSSVVKVRSEVGVQREPMSAGGIRGCDLGVEY